jgi:hypothetical protein
MPTTFTKIASVSVGLLGASSIDFTSIPSTYTDLCVKLSVRTDGINAPWLLLRFNGSTSSYTQRYVYGTGAAAASTTVGTANYMNLAAAINSTSQTISTFASADVYVPNYAGSTNKSVSTDTAQENNATTAYATLAAGLWSNTSAINQVTFFPETGNFAQYSTAVLYGIKNS